MRALPKMFYGISATMNAAALHATAPSTMQAGSSAIVY
eukprot:COSAG02_NODE_3490_length_6660_cov_5.207285_5_plen_38_part_00